MTFVLPASLLTGIEKLDEDHRHLVTCVNVIAEAEHNADQGEVLDRLTDFKVDLAEHFEAEENYLRAVNYPRRNAHATHHAEVIVALDRLARDLKAGDRTEGIAHACFHELISAVLLRDMQFLNWLADRQTGRR
ncbi:MAG: hypothetical protein BroJett029_04850 [Alphaproteobacteria bacterium]|jgi:hemerythrin-like metal-binding protein|nr:MAG: hypothetical protein BroJett029_04850 [Alphaproteobacteria bacterium]